MLWPRIGGDKPTLNQASCGSSTRWHPGSSRPLEVPSLSSQPSESQVPRAPLAQDETGPGQLGKGVQVSSLLTSVTMVPMALALPSE